MAEQLRVFVSHSHRDNAFCHQIVQALRDAGADVWYDEHNMKSGRLGPTIERELRTRPVFVVILSPAALRSPWVEDETRWAYGLQRKDQSRIILPVTAAPIAEDDIWLFLQDFKRIEAPGHQPYPATKAANRLLTSLALTTDGEAPTPLASQPTESDDNLVTRGRALAARNRYAEALPLFKLALALNGTRVSVWGSLANALLNLGRYREALVACERALALNPRSADGANIWGIKGLILDESKDYDAALVAYDHALELDPYNASTWGGKALTLVDMGRNHEAVTACERALVLDPDDAGVWYVKGMGLRALGRTAEAEAAEQRAKELGWVG